MTLSAFVDKSHQPAEGEVAEVLGAARSLWDSLIAHISQTYTPVTQAWKHYSTSSGWTLVLKQKARTVAYLLPQEGRYTVVLVYGEPAVQAVHEAGLSQTVLEHIDAAKPYAEGRSFQVEVSGAADLEMVRNLIAIKMAH